MRDATPHQHHRTSSRALARAAAALVAAALPALTGCVERRMFITSDPPGALVHLNDIEVGRTPLEVDFDFFGEYEVRVEREGYETLLTTATAQGKLHDYPGFDLLAEALPFQFKTHPEWHFTLEKAVTDPDEMIARARLLRDRLTGEPVILRPDDEEEAAPPAQEPIIIDELSDPPR